MFPFLFNNATHAVNSPYELKYVLLLYLQEVEREEEVVDLQQTWGPKNYWRSVKILFIIMVRRVGTGQKMPQT